MGSYPTRATPPQDRAPGLSDTSRPQSENPGLRIAHPRGERGASSRAWHMDYLKKFQDSCAASGLLGYQVCSPPATFFTTVDTAQPL